MSLQRRALFRGTLSVDALTMLTGCDVSDHESVRRALGAVSGWNDRVQAIFGSNRLAPTFPDAMAGKDFRYRAWNGLDKAPKLNAADCRLMLAGRIANKRPWTVGKLHTLPQLSQVTRHVCVEGWSMIGKWSGTPLSKFRDDIDVDTKIHYVAFKCADSYHEAIDMPTTLHPQTLMAVRLSDNILRTRYGYPFKIRMPTKLGSKDPKSVTTLYVTSQRPRRFWTDRGYNCFSGI